VRNTNVKLGDFDLGVSDVSIPWEMCIYIESLTKGLLEHPTDAMPSNGRTTRLEPGT
jgi:hypothetical protein